MNLRKVVDEERVFYTAVAYRMIQRAKLVFDPIYPYLESQLEKCVLSSGEYYIPAWIKTLIKEFGDPLGLQKTGLRQYEVFYWNPTDNRISIFSLGLEKEIIEPGERMALPWAYTIGGANSAVKSIAPQLQALPTPEREDCGYDISPISYLEWNTFCAIRLSLCCQKQILWNTIKNQCICQKCECAI
jgi:hypothetical protein